MMKKIVARAVIGTAAVAALVVGGSTVAFANGSVTWQDAATGHCLTGLHGTGMNVIAADCSNPYKGWTDQQNSNGTWLEHATNMDNWCLDSNASGSVYTLPCNGGAYQNWSEISTSTGWELKDQATGRCLDSNADGSVYTLPCNNGLYQRWH